MLTYEKCLELKKAGFPQKYSDRVPLSVPRLGLQEVEGSYAYKPTLSELTAECGDCFSGTIFLGTQLPDCKNSYAKAGSDITVEGKNLETAVANLYLALKKNV